MYKITPAGTLTNGLIYVVGGYTGSRSAIVQRYNPATDTWASEASMLTAKSGPVVGLLGTTIVSAGGLENSGNPTGDTEGYNATTNKWSPLMPDTTPRNGGCGAAVLGKLCVTGGSTSNLAGGATIKTESFIAATGVWTVAGASTASNDQCHAGGREQPTVLLRRIG
ncbi:MAG TPA: kelch repeat-containing protein [Candidatus Sulfotelmatobacter sp.]|nr:kelch repeat-containing protein [Candidatus Sulfotelmatobacter sp.]